MSSNNSSKNGVINPILGLTLIGAILVNGIGWIPYVFANIIFANITGFYTEAKIKELDAVMRQKAKEVSGNDQPGDANDLGELVRRTNQILGIFFPIVPAVSLVAGLWMGHKAHSIQKLDTTKNDDSRPVRLAPGFTAEGKCPF